MTTMIRPDLLTPSSSSVRPPLPLLASVMRMHFGICHRTDPWLYGLGLYLWQFRWSLYPSAHGVSHPGSMCVDAFGPVPIQTPLLIAACLADRQNLPLPLLIPPRGSSTHTESLRPTKEEEEEAEESGPRRPALFTNIIYEYSSRLPYRCTNSFPHSQGAPSAPPQPSSSSWPQPLEEQLRGGRDPPSRSTCAYCVSSRH